MSRLSWRCQSSVWLLPVKMLLGIKTRQLMDMFHPRISLYAELIEKGQTFIIEEIEEESNANCVCPYDLGYDIGPLTEGEEYSVSIRRGKSEESEVAKFIFTYSPTVKGQISRK